MMRDDAFNLHVDSVRAEITGTQHISISHVCFSEDSKSKVIIVDENLSQVCSRNKNKSESVISNESSTEESESESVCKRINKN